jgi:DNA repair ATPase RecN
VPGREAAEVWVVVRVAKYEDRYHGARYYKCDLHMHTPFAKCWKESSTKLSPSDDAERIKEVAIQYLKRCYEEGLEVIAITEHNFAKNPDESFVKRLIELNPSVAEEIGTDPIIIFPGFEIEADVGRGCHVLCLFSPDTSLAHINDKLTMCGLPSAERIRADKTYKKSTKRLTELIEIIQRGNDPGIIICPHCLNQNGILSDDELEIWLQQEEFRNTDLLCVEISSPLGELTPNLQKLLQNGEDCSDGWKRDRPIACIMSSDAHTITTLKKDKTNYIGFRSTWIKMSNPSIESLRQAFLDHDSRIKLSTTCPEDKFDYPTIKRFEITNAKFLKSEPILFSPNLNCIIGGRGTGKSTTLDYLRLVLDQISSDDIPQDLKAKLKEKYDNTLEENSQIILEFNKSGVDYQVKYEHINESRSIIRIDGNETPENLKINELFPIRILSQGEIDKRIDSTNKNSLLKIIDNFVISELTYLEREEEKTVRIIRQYDLEIDSISKNLENIPSIQTKIVDLFEQIKRLEAIKPDIEKWETISKYHESIRELNQYHENLKITLSNTIKEIPDLPSIPEEPFEHNDEFRKIFDILKKSKETLVLDINSAIDSFVKENSDENTELNKHLGKWNKIYEVEEENYQLLKQELIKKGDDPDKYLQLKRDLADCKNDLSSLEIDKSALTTLFGERNKSLLDLRDIWDRRTEVRRNKATELMVKLCPKKSSKPLLKITFIPQADIFQIKEEWNSHLIDKRSLNGQDIENYIVGMKVHCPTEIPLHKFLLDTLNNDVHKENRRSILENRLDKFDDIFNEKIVHQLEIRRIDDEVKFDVYRLDGSLAGSIDRVSAGQKGLAIIHLLLASGEEPLIIDTPEEGLDNEGVFTELVPLFRAEKEKRQIILVTHNANLPVNGDSELIITFDTIGSLNGDVEHEVIEKIKDKSDVDTNHVINLIQSKKWDSEIDHYLDSKNIDPELKESIKNLIYDNRAVYGQIKKWKQDKESPIEYCLGALDNNSVKKAVQSIMEGSEHAFRQRSEKYGF